MSHSLQPKPGFDWLLVEWRGPKQRRIMRCSYCAGPLRENEVPLMLWNKAGWLAQFCTACQQKHWGIEVFEEPQDDDEEDTDGRVVDRP